MIAVTVITVIAVIIIVVFIVVVVAISARLCNSLASYTHWLTMQSPLGNSFITLKKS